MEKILGKMLSIGNTFLTKCKVLRLSLPVRHSNIDVLYVPTTLQNNWTKMLKLLWILEKIYPDDTNVFASNIIDKSENWPDNLYSLCLADIASSFFTKKADDLPIQPDEIKSYTVPVSNINDVKLKACVRYFLTNFYFLPNDSPSKTIKNVFYFI